MMTVSRVMTRWTILLFGFVISSCSHEITAPSGAVIWHVPGHAGAGRPAVDDSTVYFVAAADSHAVHAFDLASGKIRWTAVTGAVNGGFFSLDGCLLAVQVVACGDITDIVAFDRSDGHLVWRYHPDVGQPGVLPSSIDSAKTTIFAPTQTGAIHAIDAATGQSRWIAQPVSSNTALYRVLDGGDLVFAPFTVFARKDTGGVVALAKSDGSIRWLVRFPLAADSSNGAKDAVLWGNYVIVSTEDGRISALDRATGQLAWTLPGVGVYPDWFGPPGPVGGDLRMLIVAGSSLIAASQSGWVVSYDLPTDAETWRATINHSATGFLETAHDGTAAYLTSTSGFLFSVSLTPPHTLSQIAAASLVTAFLTPPALAADRVLIGSKDGYYAIRR
jgi:outer membrane protein assembly factor BamB